MTHDVVIDELGGSHASEKTFDDVTLFSVWSQICHYIPKGIDKFFKNLEFIEFGKCGLKAVSDEDFKPFTKLKVLWLKDNELKSLGPGLFEFNPNLKSISLENNKINLIHQTVFDPIEDLDKLHFTDNLCASKNGEGRIQVKRVIREIIENCSSFRSDSLLTDEITNLKKEVKKLQGELARVTGDLDQLTTF